MLAETLQFFFKSILYITTSSESNSWEILITFRYVLRFRVYAKYAESSGMFSKREVSQRESFTLKTILRLARNTGSQLQLF